MLYRNNLGPKPSRCRRNRRGSGNNNSRRIRGKPGSEGNVDRDQQLSREDDGNNSDVPSTSSLFSSSEGSDDNTEVRSITVFSVLKSLLQLVDLWEKS